MRFDKLCREISSLKNMNYIKIYCYNKLLVDKELIDILTLIENNIINDSNISNNNIISNYDCIMLSLIDFYNDEYISNVCSIIDNGSQIEGLIRQKGLSLYHDDNLINLPISSNELLKNIINNINNSIKLLNTNNQIIQRILMYIFNFSYRRDIKRKINPDYNIEIDEVFSLLEVFIDKFRTLNKCLEEKIFSEIEENNYEHGNKKTEIKGGKFIENSYDIDEIVSIIRWEF